MIATDTTNKKLLHALTRAPASTQELAERFKLPRTTVGYRLRRLEQHGHVCRKQMPGTRGRVWQVRTGTVYGKQSIRIFEGPAFYEGYTLLWKIPKESGVYVVQGRDAIKAEYKHIPKSFIQECQRIYKRKGIVVKCLVHEKSLDFVDVVEDAVMKDHVGRSIGFKFLFDRPGFRNTCEIICTQSALLLVNVHLRRIVVLHDSHIAACMYQLLALLYEITDEPKLFTKTMDFNQYFQNKLDSRSNRV